MLFDAIEFDQKVASIDVLYDLAFPLMDLIRYGRQAEANALLNRYLSITSDENLDALAALPLLLSIRAAIRAHVLLARLDRQFAGKALIVEMARAYFELAQSIDPSAGANADRGRRSVGHRQIGIGARLAPSRRAAAGGGRVRSDVLRKQLFEVGETERLPARRLPAGGERADLRRVVGSAAHIAFAGSFRRGRRGICPRGGARRDRGRCAQAEVSALSACFWWPILQPVKTASRGGGDASDATAEVAGQQEKYNIGALDWASIDACGSPEPTLEQCRIRIADFQATH